MIRIESRESAHVRSRVKDLSVVPNIESFNGLFACLTPISATEPDADGNYSPVLVRDVDSLIRNFGDPRIDPEKYCDLYCVMQLVGNGGTCYITRVPDGKPGEYTWYAAAPSEPKSVTVSTNTATLSDTSAIVRLYSTSGSDVTEYTRVSSSPKKNEYTVDGSGSLTITFGADSDGLGGEVKAECVTAPTDVASISVTSNVTSDLGLVITCDKGKPYALHKYIVKATLLSDGVPIKSVKFDFTGTDKGDVVKTDASIVAKLNSEFSAYAKFELKPTSDEYSIAKQMYYVVNNNKDTDQTTDIKQFVGALSVDEDSAFNVDVKAYVKAVELYKDKRYTGCIIGDMTAPVTENGSIAQMSNDDRRNSLHLALKGVATERKDTTVILSAPYKEGDELMSLDDICDWVASRGAYDGLWEYGEPDTVDYAAQSFYMEMYSGWLNMRATKIVNGSAESVSVEIAPATVVVENILRSFRERGTHHPVAGDFYGTLPESCSVIKNVATKAERDRLVQDRINPIYDTGTRGVQIYGNETLNAGYTDLNAAHIARTLVRIRSLVDAYTETIKFSLNNELTYGTWKNYVTANILEPLKSVMAISSYTVAMGRDTTSPEEIANRIVNGQITLTFVQSAEIFDLTFTVYSSSTAEE